MTDTHNTYAPSVVQHPACGVLSRRTADLSWLEYEGWAVVAVDRLRVRPGDARALRELVFSPGRYIPHERLAQCFRGRGGSGPAQARLTVRFAQIRNALEDLGVPRHAIENDWTEGYAVAAHFARQIRSLIEVQQ